MLFIVFLLNILLINVFYFLYIISVVYIKYIFSYFIINENQCNLLMYLIGVPTYTIWIVLIYIY